MLMSNKKAQDFLKSKKEKVKDKMRSTGEGRQYDPNNPKHRLKADVMNERSERQEELRKDNKFSTNYKYAVPTGTGGRFNTSQASGPNIVSEYKPVGSNKTGGTNYERTKIVGDPTGSGSTGRIVSEKKYDRLFTGDGKYAPRGDGSAIFVPDNVGKKYKEDKNK